MLGGVGDCYEARISVRIKAKELRIFWDHWQGFRSNEDLLLQHRSVFAAIPKVNIKRNCSVLVDQTF